MIQVDNISQIALLARLVLTEEEKKIFSKDLSRVFEWVEQLENVCLQGLPKTQNSLSKMAPDEAKACPSRDTLLENAPEKEDGFFMVPQVVG